MSGKTVNFFMVWLDKVGFWLFDSKTVRGLMFTPQPDQLPGDGDGDGAVETGVIVTCSSVDRRAFCTFA